jgi:hypothetical protein
LDLKEEYKKVTGVAWSPTPNTSSQANNVPPKKVEKVTTEKSSKAKQVSVDPTSL